MEKKSFKESLNLPRTDFTMRADFKITDPLMIERWVSQDLFHKSFICNIPNQKYILHDGPPYANGNIHLGHAYNKILKDIVGKSHRMAGYHVPITPGWDCHGLPIEQKVTQERKDSGLPPYDAVALKKACRDYANNWINIQRKSFKQLGVLMDWDNPYITMSPQYEAATVEAFGQLVKGNFIERKNKTVPWCFHDETVLAAAEIEYKDRKDPSIYVLFELEKSSSINLFGLNQDISLIIWTTTPWTLPLNEAVLVKPNSLYSLVEVNNKSYYLVGSEIAKKLGDLLEADVKIIKEFNSNILANVKAIQPYMGKIVPLIFDESVGLDEGTAFVHCAPGCGPIDYEIGVKNNLPIFSPISSDGRYSDEIGNPELVGMSVTDGQIWMIKKLDQEKKLLLKKTIVHSYPHCWRCHQGLIFRATPQWFFNLNHNSVKDQAIKTIDNINFIPANGRSFLKATVSSRWEWCLSRQRAWGVPIPALICNICSYSYLTEELVNKVAKGIREYGIEYWDTVDIHSLIDVSTICPQCKSHDFKKEKDILDVWFDSGVSHYAVLHNNPELKFPADIYVEGVDQHRGWFQSSLLTSLVLEQEPCTTTFMTHGYTVDAKGQKMSKSLGNITVPEDIIQKIGTDGLRLWVATIGSASDPIVSESLLTNVAEVYRKIRNTCRFLLSNLYDFDINHDKIEYNDLLFIDQYALITADKINKQLIQNYLESDFTVVFHKLADYCSVELSSFYLDVVKDRLYTDLANGHQRRSAQTVLFYILDSLTKLIAPIMSITAEYITDYSQKNKSESIHLQQFNHLGRLANIPVSSEKDALLWELLKEIRNAVLKAIEIKREQGIIKLSLEAHVTIFINLENPKFQVLDQFFRNTGKEELKSFLKEFFIVSQLTILDNSLNLELSSDKAIYIKVEHASGNKCPRCWQWNTNGNIDSLCYRCEQII